MKTLFGFFSGLALLTLILCMIANSCLAKEVTTLSPLVYDNNLNTAYIEVDPRLLDDPRATITSLISMKSSWQSANPTKRIVAIATTTFGGAGKKETTHTSGLIIHYEIIQPKDK